VIAYLDSSVLLRVLLRAPGSLPEWFQLEGGVASTLIRVESCRTFDRLVHDSQMTGEEYAAKVKELDDVLGRITVVPISDHILESASERLPVRLASLDALHLATAVDYAEKLSEDEMPLRFATHDIALAAAARSAGFEVIGV
jgi:predicted nucleic acid-binding protein